MYYAMKKTTRLVRERPCVVLFEASDTGHLRYVHPVYAILLASCDGRRDDAALLRILTEDLAFTPERAQELLARVLRDVAPFLETSEEPADRPNRYDPSSFIYHPEGDHRPAGAQWLAGRPLLALRRGDVACRLRLADDRPPAWRAGLFGGAHHAHPRSHRDDPGQLRS